jgi:hypothetical protein
MPYQRLAAQILEEWQTAHDHASQFPEGSVERTLFRSVADVLRDEYQHLIDEAIAHDRPVPPPFSDAP